MLSVLPTLAIGLVKVELDPAFRTQSVAAPQQTPQTRRGLSIFSSRGFFIGAAFVGNDGFDPLQIATADNLVPLRHAEIKHGRLAMLAALGIPVQEAMHPMFVEAFKAKHLLLEDGRSPSLLTGGLEQPEVLPALVLMAAIGAAFELKEVSMRTAQGLGINEWSKASVAGDVSFDPLGLSSNMPVTDRFELQQAEMLNGRLAMLMVMAYMAIEMAVGVPVVSLWR